LQKFFLIIGSLAITIALASSSALALDAPLVRTQALLKTFEGVQSAKPGQAPTDAMKKANAETYKRLDSFFDRDALTAEAIAPYKSKFAAPQLARYGELFWELIRLVAYPDALRGAKWSTKLGPQQGDLADVIVHARKEADDLETDVTFRWKHSGDNWRVYDVAFDGASLVSDYRNQFGKIIAKDGVPGLLKKLESRYNDERKKRGEAAP
jgi:phospholipid transport system substrate-binding protein